MNDKLDSSPWYSRRRPVILALVLFFPAGLYAIWKGEHFSKPVRWAVSVLGSLLFLAIIASPRSTPRPPSGEVVSRPVVRDASHRRLGESFRVGDFTYLIERVERREVIGNALHSEQAGAGAVFLVVHYRVRNEGDSTARVLSDQFRLVDAGGRTFEVSSRASTALMMSGQQQDFLLSELQPGIFKAQVSAFEVPVEALAGLRLEIPEGGLFGGVVAVVLEDG